MKLLLDISYVGTAYHGYQVQPGLSTVQGTLQKALEDFYGVPLMLTGCSRTDAGVHARQFCLTVEGDLFENMPPEKLPLAMVSRLPGDISVNSAVRVDDTFHARYDVKYKEYEYLILNSPLPDPFFKDRAWHCPVPLDTGLMNAAAGYFTGKHDFAAVMAAGSAVNSTVREIYGFDCRREGKLVIIRVSADGFLYNMVRIMSGTLVQAGGRKIEPRCVKEILESHDRTRAGETLPPEGLYLNRVVYK